MKSKFKSKFKFKANISANVKKFETIRLKISSLKKEIKFILYSKRFFKKKEFTKYIKLKIIE